jgi:hypothetical protein
MDVFIKFYITPGITKEDFIFQTLQYPAIGIGMEVYKSFSMRRKPWPYSNKPHVNTQFRRVGVRIVVTWERCKMNYYLVYNGYLITPTG